MSCSNMLSHILRGFKELLTEASLKGPLFSVCSLVQLNLWCSFEALLTFVATKRLSSLCTLLWFLSMTAVLKPFAHNAHLNGVSLLCCFKFFAVMKALSHWEHLSRSRSVWVFSCALTSANLLKLFSHWLHLKDLSSMWTTWWFASVSRVLKYSPHWSHCKAFLLLWTVELCRQSLSGDWWHLKGLSLLCTALCSLRRDALPNDFSQWLHYNIFLLG